MIQTTQHSQNVHTPLTLLYKWHAEHKHSNISLVVKTINVKGTFRYFVKHLVFQGYRAEAARLNLVFSYLLCFNPLSFAFLRIGDEGKTLFLLVVVRT